MNFSGIATLLMICGAPLLAHASIIPAKKPVQNNFTNLIETTIQTTSKSIILPPALPEIKRRITTQTLANNGVPLPTSKPLFVVATKTPIPIKPDDNDGDDAGDDEDDDDEGSRMAGSKWDRVKSQPKIRLRETMEKSPFKTAKLPKAPSNRTTDPVIIFFKEKTSDLEVGQLSILNNDVLNYLKNNQTKTISIYGYAGKQSQNDPHELSLARALMISEYLADRRVSKDRIEIRSMGTDTPISPKHRVDIIIQ